MRFQLVVCLFLVAMVSVVIVCAQSQQTSAPAAQSPLRPPKCKAPLRSRPLPRRPRRQKLIRVIPSSPSRGSALILLFKGDACKTVITKEQFDKMIDDLQPGMAPPMRRRFAMQYASALSMVCRSRQASP